MIFPVPVNNFLEFIIYFLIFVNTAFTNMQK